MGLYLGKDKVKINLNGKAYNINMNRKEIC